MRRTSIVPRHAHQEKCVTRPDPIKRALQPGWLELMAVLLVTTEVWLRSSGPVPPAPEEHPEAVASVRPRATSMQAMAAPDTASVPAPPKGVPLLDITRLLHARDAYAAAVRAWQSGQPGGFFAADALTNACGDALNGPWMSVQGFPTPLIASGALRPDMPAGWEGDPPQRQAARLAALQEAQARCSTLREHRRVFHEPHAADGASRQLLEASAKLGAGGKAVPFDERRTWLVTLDQAKAWLNPDYVMVFATDSYADANYFEGQRWGGASSAEAYDRAVRLAGQAYSFDASAAQRSVATLAVCIRMGACDGRLEDLVLADLPAKSPMRAEVLHLYPRMLSALRNGNIDAFAPPKPPRPNP